MINRWALPEKIRDVTVFGEPADPLVTALALCKYEGDPDWWFPTWGSPESARNAKRAVEVCSRCQCRKACLNEAMACGPKLSGIWGGTSQRERQRRLGLKVSTRRQPKQKGK